MRLALRSAVVSMLVFAARSQGQVPDTVHRPKPRIVGVFDSRTGQPLSNVRVTDSISGDYVMTTVTGTARIDFLTFADGVAVAELRRVGYQPRRLLVRRADTVSVTEVMVPIVELAPMVVTETYRIDRDPGKWEGFAQRCSDRLITCFNEAALTSEPSANSPIC